MPTNYKQLFAVQAKNKNRLQKANPLLNNNPGIYFLTRMDENGFKYAYIGQAKHILDRLCQHLSGYNQHIDLSLRKHSLCSESNPYGWKVGFINCPVAKLDELEQYWIKKYADSGYQLRNKTSGSQGEGKSKIDEYKPAKGYRDGIEAGYRKASREIAHLFNLHLVYKPAKDPPTQNQLKAAEKFKAFLEYHKDGGKNV